MDDDRIGVRVRHWRLKRGLSQRTLAQLAGFSQGYIAQIEAGTAPLDKRSAQGRIAAALQVSVADLTGQPYDPQTVEHSAAAAAMPQVRAALTAISLGYERPPGKPASTLRQAVNHAAELHDACQYDRLTPVLPELLLDLSSSGDDASNLRMLTWTTYAAVFSAKYLGFADLALIAAEQCRRAAARLDDPEWNGVAEFAVLHALPAEARHVAEDRARRAIDRAIPSTTASAQVCGMLHLTAAMFKATAGRADDAYTHLDAAAEIATRTGESNFAHMWFGPTNVAIWRTGIYAELGEGGRVRDLGEINLSVLKSRNRRATYYADRGRALAQTRRDDHEAVTSFLRAESIAPLRIRLSPPVRETVGSMLRRARSTAGGRHLQGLAERLGTL